ncbi:MAG: hypothetical protein WBH44_09685 [Proteocatella sp.]
MKKTKNKKVAKNIGAILISSTLCISTLGISYAYFGEYIISDVNVTTAQMSIENVESGKIEYDYSQKKLIIIFELQNTGDVPVKLYIKDAEATMNRFFMEGMGAGADYADFSGDDGERSFREVDTESFDGQELEASTEIKEFVLEFTDVDVEDYENAYFETEIELEYVYLEAESWKGTVEIEATDENRQLQAQRFLEYMESKDSETVQSGGEAEATAPEATAPDAAEPEATVPEVAEPEATVPESTEPEAAEPEVTVPEVAEPEATEPEATVPDAAEPDAAEPEVTVPEVAEPEATEPEATVPKAAEPEAAEPEPEATVPEAAEPEATASEAAEPQASAPEASAPEAESSQSSDSGVDVS